MPFSSLAELDEKNDIIKYKAPAMSWLKQRA